MISPSETDTVIFSDPLQLICGINVNILSLRFTATCSLPTAEYVSSSVSISVADRATADRSANGATTATGSRSKTTRATT